MFHLEHKEENKAQEPQLGDWIEIAMKKKNAAKTKEPKTKKRFNAKNKFKELEESEEEIECMI